MRILLIAAALEGDLDNYPEDRGNWVQKALPGLLPKAYMPPLSLATIKGITPDEHEVVLHDEAVQGAIGPDDFADEHFDLVGVTGYSNHLLRAVKLGDLFRERGIYTVIGGAGVTEEPETCAPHFDTMFLGESELTWPRFLDDFARGEPEAVYKEAEFIDLSTSPKPQWGNLSPLLASSYKTGGIQVNRGCPHSCEFCNIWIQFGRKMRVKPVPQVIEEMRELKKLGMERVMFCSDNFVGNPKYAKKLLREVIKENMQWDMPLRFFTELTLIIARDEELLDLLARAPFPGVFIGLETPNVASLKETRKHHNLFGSMVDQCHAIQRHGMYVIGSFIVGFDSDTPEIFDTQARFIQEACLPAPRLNVLYAGRGTALRDRMMREGRVMDVRKSFAAVSHAVPGDSFVTNIIPKGMTRVELYEGYLRLLRQVWDWDRFEERVVGFLDKIEKVPDRPMPQVLADRVAWVRKALGQAPEANIDAIEHIFSKAESLSPHLLPGMAEQIALLMFERSRLPVLEEDLERHIELERAMEAANAVQLKVLDKRGKGLRPEVR